jgi:2-polyprenyl-3-methyl-5-hydroxy-6-metoxy-1,4-benzoquinol methylase
MKRNYWEKIAHTYNDEIFDVLHHDKKRLIRSAIKKNASKKKTVIDIGCAIGKWLPILSSSFKKVYAVDISSKNLEIARQLHSNVKNIEYLQADMSGSNSRLPACDFGICINAVLTTSQKDRNTFFKSLSSCIKKRGSIIITVPSLESYLLTSIVQHQWNIDKELFPPTKDPKEAMRQWNNIKQGNADIDNVPHKHYLKEELQLVLSKEGFKTEELKKIEYDWKTEFHSPPKWLKEVYPWDWMVVAKKL